jgi:hypothetical protein
VSAFETQFPQLSSPVSGWIITYDQHPHTEQAVLDIPRIPPYRKISKVSPSSGANSLGALGSSKQTRADVEPNFSTNVKIGSVWRCALDEDDGVVVSRYFWRGGMEDWERDVKWS